MTTGSPNKLSAATLVNLFCHLPHPTAHGQFFYSCCFQCCQIQDIVGGSTADSTYKKQEQRLGT